MAVWQDGGLLGWQVGGAAVWWAGRLTGWPFGG